MAGLELSNSECQFSTGRAVVSAAARQSTGTFCLTNYILKRKKRAGILLYGEANHIVVWDAVLQLQWNEWDSLWIDSKVISLPNLHLVTHICISDKPKKKPVWTYGKMSLISIQFLALPIAVISLKCLKTCCRNLGGEGEGGERKLKSQIRWEVVH